MPSKFLNINTDNTLGGSSASDTAVPSQKAVKEYVDGKSLPSQTGNSGKFLTTNGTTASWGEIAEYTAQEVETLWSSL